jgi:hypothetical protein
MPGTDFQFLQLAALRTRSVGAAWYPSSADSSLAACVSARPTSGTLSRVIRNAGPEMLIAATGIPECERTAAPTQRSPSSFSSSSIA